MRTEPPFDMDRWRSYVLDSARKEAPQTPSGDWAGMFIIDGDSLDLVPTFPMRRDRATWEKACSVWLPAMLVAKEGRAFALVDHIWQSDTPAAIAAGTALVDPRRTEAVLIVLGGIVDSEVLTESWSARVSRLGAGPPLLGPWREQLKIDGFRVDNMRQALRRNAQLP